MKQELTIKKPEKKANDKEQNKQKYIIKNT